jgi:divalent metal cation (Fe/Co/Zn/Cd) transporter
VGAVFLVWSYPLFRGQHRAPLRSVVLAAASVVLSVAFFVYAWIDGMTHQGPVQTIAMAGYNLVSIVVVFWLFRHNRASPSSGSNLAFHTALFLWLAYCAFPWLGELL